jgi:hypothetical protein
LGRLSVGVIVGVATAHATVLTTQLLEADREADLGRYGPRSAKLVRVGLLVGVGSSLARPAYSEPGFVDPSMSHVQEHGRSLTSLVISSKVPQEKQRNQQVQ